MAYVKNTWVNQNVSRPKTYEVTTNQDGSITLTDSFGIVTELGTPVNATNMNHIEDGIYNNDTHIGDLTQLQTDDKTDLVSAINEVADSGAMRNIGEIIASTLPLVDAGLHLLDGALLNYGSYQAFIDYIADIYDSGDYPDLFETEANWQSAVTTYGVCGKFVYTAASGDDPATVRLPKWGSQAFTKSPSGTIPVKGNGMALGLTNGTYNFSPTIDTGSQYNRLNWNKNGYGANVGDTLTSGFVDTPSLSAFGVTTDGTKSGIVADLSSINNYPLDCYYYIVVATSTKTEIEVDIDEIATDLNGKADVDGTNMIASVKNFDGQWVESFLVVADNVTYPTATDIDYDLSSYLPNDNYNYEVIIGIRVITGSTSGNVVWARIYTDLMTGSAQVAYAQTRTSSNVGAASSIILPVGSGRSVSVYRNSGGVGTFTLYVNGYRRIGTNQ